MDTKGRLEQVAKHLNALNIHPALMELPFEFHPYINHDSSTLWKCKAYYNSPIGTFLVEVRMEIGEYFAKLWIINEYRVVYKEVIDFHSLI